MNIAVIGGGFTGLTAAYELVKKGHRVTVFEKEATLGGLAYGFKEKNWHWHLEYAYHHWFTNDDAVLILIKELGLAGKVMVKRPVTANLYHGKPYQFDSPLHLLLFPGLSITDKLRTGALLTFLKLTPFWRPLEQDTAQHILSRIGGQHAYEVVWEPLLVGKFGSHAPYVSAAWFWARIKKRTPALAYMQGGFHTLVTALAQAITIRGGEILTKTSVATITQMANGKFNIVWGRQQKQFDKVLSTSPTPITFTLMPSVVTPTTKPLLTIPHLWAQTLILETDRPILDRVYWLNITDRQYPFLAAVAHTNFMDPIHYGKRHLTYFGNYLPQAHRYLSLTKNQLMGEFMPFITRLAGGKKFKILKSFMFIGPFAQPVHEKNYSRKIPPIATTIPGFYMANMDFIVPWDRGTNYAVELGQKAAAVMLS